jgi:Tfp pilus assembly protein PilF
VALIKAKLFTQAPRYLKRAIAANKRDVNYQLALSHAYLEQSKLEQAVSWLESVLVLDPKNATANEILPKVKEHLASSAK